MAVFQDEDTVLGALAREFPGEVLQRHRQFGASIVSGHLESFPLGYRQQPHSRYLVMWSPLWGVSAGRPIPERDAQRGMFDPVPHGRFRSIRGLRTTKRISARGNGAGAAVLPDCVFPVRAVDFGRSGGSSRWMTPGLGGFHTGRASVGYGRCWTGVSDGGLSV